MIFGLGIRGAVCASGAASLIFETVWIRAFGLALGSTLVSLALVTAVFFLGMAGGAALAARLLPRVRRPLLWYAGLELAVGLWAVASLPLIERSHQIYALSGAAGSMTEVALELGVVLGLLAPPALAMGMSLPLLVGALARERTAQRVAVLYAANTLGAAGGVLLAGLVLIATLGALGALGVGLALDVVAATLALLAERSRSRSEVLTAPAATAPGAAGALIYVLAALLGFAGMGYEVLYFRALHLLLMGTLETLSAVLATYLLGLVLGSALYHRWARARQASWSAVAVLVLVQAGLVLLTTSALLPVGWLSLAVSEAGGGAALLQRMALAALIVLPAATLGGALLPALIDACGQDGGGALAGRVLASNTLGAVAGSLLVGTLLLPRVGTTAALYLVLLATCAGALALGFRERRRPLALGALVLLLVASLAWPGVDMARLSLLRLAPGQPLLATLARVDELAQRARFAAEGQHGTVVVIEEPPGVWTLYIDGLPQATRRRAAPRLPPESVLLGTVPAALASAQERALVIGLGGGITVEALLAAGVDRVDVAEIEPRVVEALQAMHDGAPAVDAHPRVRVLADDARKVLQRARHAQPPPRYDVIASQPSHWWLSGVGNLATEEFFLLARAALSDGGVYFQWINAGRMTEEVLRGVVHAMAAAFDEVWLLAGEQRGLFYLAGLRAPGDLDALRLRERLARSASGMPDVPGPRSPEDLAALVVLSGRPPTTARAPRNRDRDALIETRLARVAGDHHVDVSTLQPPLLDRPGPPPALLEACAGSPAAVLLELAERRLQTPAGVPAQLHGNLDGEQPFGEVWRSVTRLSVAAATRVASPCAARYLSARLALLDDDFEPGLTRLTAACADDDADGVHRRALRLAALLALERGACPPLREQLARLPALAPVDTLVLGMLQACAGEDPGPAYRQALASWATGPAPGPALRWAAEHAEPIPPSLVQRVLADEGADTQALAALLHAPTVTLSPPLATLVAERATRSQEARRQRLTALAERTEARGELERARHAARALLELAPRDLRSAARLLRIVEKLGRRDEARQLIDDYARDATDPPAARRELVEAARQRETP